MEHNRKKRYEKRKKIKKLDDLVEQHQEVFEEKTNSSTENSGDSCVNVMEVSNSSHSDSSRSDNDVYEYGSSESSSICDNCDSEQEFISLQEEAKEIQEIQAWIVANNVPHKHADQLLKILTRRLLRSLPKCTKTLLKCEVNLDNIETMKVHDGSDGEFMYFGIEDQLVESVDVQLHDSQILELIINIDGMSPFKSSPVTVWPILCKVYTQSDLYEPFTIGLFSGNGKPKCCCDYLKKFIEEINHLQKYGVKIKNKMFQVKIKFFVCDSPARSFLKCVVSHVAFNACERCKVLGQKVDKVTVFLKIDAEKRSDAGFRSFEDPDCHISVSPLCAIEPPINLVSQFVLDPMHLLYLGCTKRLLEYLLSTSSHKVRLSASQKTELTRRTRLTHRDIPEEFPRKMRSTEHYSKYKAVEFKFFALYAAPIVLKKLVSDDVYNHFMHFTVACRLLSDKNRHLHIAKARQHLNDFVKKISSLYGPTFLSLNVHNLIHICDDVETLGCSLSELSAFPFESYLGSISSVLRSPTRIVAQCCRRLKEKQKFLKKVITVPPELEVLVQRKNQIHKIKYKGMTLSLIHPNNTVVLQDDSVVEICQFYYKDDKILMIEAKKYLKKESLFKYPCSSETINIWEVSRMSNTAMTVPLERIKQKLVKLRVNFSNSEEKRSFVVPLLH